MAAGEPSVRITGAKADELDRLHGLALKETIDVILTKLADGKQPKRVAWPQLSMQDNGMPSISGKPLFGGNGAIQYSDVLEPPWDDDRKRAEGKFPKADFPAMSALTRFVATEPDVAAAYISVFCRDAASDRAEQQSRSGYGAVDEAELQEGQPARAYNAEQGLRRRLEWQRAPAAPGC